MVETAITLFGLDCMRERVAEVEQRAFAEFERIAFDDCRLVRAAAGDGFAERAVVAGEQRTGSRVEPVEERRVDDRTVLDHFGKSCAQLAFRQGAQRSEE